MKAPVIALISALTASVAWAQTPDLTPKAAAAAHAAAAHEAAGGLPGPECKVPPKGGPIAGVAVGSSLALGGILLAGAGSVDLDQDGIESNQRAMQITGFAMIGTGVAATIVGAIYLHRAKYRVCTLKRRE